MKTIKLTDSDYQTLCLLLGYCAGAHIKDGTPLPQAMRDLTDWVLIQGDENNYTYYNDKNALAKIKMAELERQ